MTFAAGSFAAIARIHAIKNNVSIAWLYETFTSMTGLYPAKRETVAFLCLGFASVLFGLGLHEWMKLNGHRKWKRIAGPILLACVLLISSLLIGWFSLAKDQIFQSEEDKTRRDNLREKIQNAKPGESLLLEGEDLHMVMLAGVKLKKAKMKGANLELAMLAGADLRQTNLEYANLKNAMLLGTNLSKAKLENTNFEGANLLGALLEGARIDGANFNNAAHLTQNQLDEACGKPRILPEGLKAPKPC